MRTGISARQDDSTFALRQRESRHDQEYLTLAILLANHWGSCMNMDVIVGS